MATKYGDIGKSCKDLFGKDFPVGSIKIESKTKAEDGSTFTVNASRDNVAGFVAGDLKHKISNKTYGIDVTNTVSTSNVLSTNVEFKDVVTKGLKLNANGSLAPGGKQAVKLGLEFGQGNMFSTAALDLFKGPAISGDLAFKVDSFLVGGQVAYDAGKGSIKTYNAAAAYSVRDYTVSVHALNSLSLFSLAYWHRVNGTVEAGGKATMSAKEGLDFSSGKVGIEFGAKYALDGNAFVKAKLDNNGILGLGYTQTLRPGFKMTMGGSFDTSKLNDNSHKIGLSMTIDA